MGVGRGRSAYSQLSQYTEPKEKATANKLQRWPEVDANSTKPHDWCSLE